MPFQIKYTRAPKAADVRAKNWQKAREAYATTTYTAKMEAVDVDTVKTAHEDLAALDRMVGDILTKHGIFKRDRVKYLSFAREIYRFMRRYGAVPADYIEALVTKYRIEHCDVDILREIVNEMLGTAGGAPAPAAPTGQITL